MSPVKDTTSYTRTDLEATAVTSRLQDVYLASVFPSDRLTHSGRAFYPSTDIRRYACCARQCHLPRNQHAPCALDDPQPYANIDRVIPSRSES